MLDVPLRLDPIGVGEQPAPAWRKSHINTRSFCDKFEARCSKQVVDVARLQLENLLQPLVLENV